MVVKARSALTEILRKFTVTGREHKDFVSLLNGTFYIVTALVRADILCTVIILLENIRNFAPLVTAHLNVAVSLVILKQNIILWCVLFNKTALKNKRLKLAVCDNVFKVVNIVNHTAHLFCVVILRAKVLAYTIAQSLCLADINNFSVSRVHNINTGQQR